MKNNLLKKAKGFTLLAFGSMLALCDSANAQVVVPFKKRVSSANTYDSIYHIQGDFAMIGNSNLTVSGTLSNSSTNSNTSMAYNKLAGDPVTIVNSSSANLAFRSENGSDPNCTKVLFAGLYWTGRTTDGTTITPMEWYAYSSANPTSNVIVDTVNTTYNVINRAPIATNIPGFLLSFPNRTNNNDASYSQNISNITYNILRYQFDGWQYEFGVSGTNYILRYRESTSTNRGNNSDWTVLNSNQVSFTTNGSMITANILVDTVAGLPLNNSYTSGPTNNVSATANGRFLVKSFTRSNVEIGNNHASKNAHAAGSASVGRAYLTVDSRVITTTTYPNQALSKNQIKLKGPGDVAYTPFTANVNDIYYPTATTSEAGIYSAFVDVTAFVKQRGEGTYAVADLATGTGNGGDIGYFGGWSLVVVYENYKMEWRDITVFDGHAFVEAGTNNANTSHELPITGFRARQNGPVNIKMGIMAGEGDRSISGDYFRAYNKTTSQFVSLSHDGNSGTNFFNSSISLGTNVTRVPDYSNNTGIDIAVFELDNDNKDYIRNSDNTVTFQYGSNQDTYTIPLIVFAVDAYVPVIAPINQVAFINSMPLTNNTTIEPGDTVTYQLVVKNLGAEAIEDADFGVAIPFTTSFLDMNVNYYLNSGNRPTPSFDSTLGVNGMIHWGVIDEIPRPTANQSDTFATLTYRLIATTDCYVLMNPICAPSVIVDGFANGIGQISREVIEHLPFISGYVMDGTCQGAPKTTPVELTIDAVQYVSDNCGADETVLKYLFCEATGTGTVPLTDNILNKYPAGSKFYNDNPSVNQNAVEFTVATGMPYNTAVDTLTYFVIPPISSHECTFQFKVIASEMPIIAGFTQECKDGVFIVSATPSNLTFTVLDVFENPRYPIVPTPAPNSTGIISGLKGVDSILIAINNGPACALESMLIFDDCIQQLPVEFVSFSAVKNNANADLKWVVAKEENVKNYIVQRSSNGADFENVITVNATEASPEMKTYTATDFKPLPGKNYYRIKQVDFDGKSGYTNIRMVTFEEGNAQARLYPIPAQTSITLELDAAADGVIEYWTINSVAQSNSPIIKQEINKGRNLITLDIAHFVNGVYVLAYKINNEEQVKYLKFTKSMGK